MTLSPLFTREGHRERGNVCARFSDPWNDYRLVPASSSKLFPPFSLSLSVHSQRNNFTKLHKVCFLPLIDRRGLEDNGQGARVQRGSNSAQGNIFVQRIRQAIRQEQSATYQNPYEAGAVEKIGQDRRYEEEGWRREPREATIETGGQSVGD